LLVNLAEKNISIGVEKIYSLGPKFAHDVTKVSYERLITDVEYIIHQPRVPGVTKTEVHQRISGMLIKMKNLN